MGCEASGYLAKPVAAEALMTAVRNVLAGEVGSALVVEDDADASRLLASHATVHTGAYTVVREGALT